MVSPKWEQIWEKRIEKRVNVIKLHKEYNGNINEYLRKELPENPYILNAKEVLIENLEQGKSESYNQIEEIADKEIIDIEPDKYNDGVPKEYAELVIEESDEKYDKQVEESENKPEKVVDIDTQTKEQVRRKNAFLNNVLSTESTQAKKDKTRLKELRDIAVEAGDLDDVINRIDGYIAKLKETK